ncbi:MAG: S8/S53 family peptidase [Chitinophagales bacterium]
MRTISEKLFFPLLLAIGFLLLRNVNISAQDRDHVPGDILVMIQKGADINKILKSSSFLNGAATEISAEQNLSQRLNIWQFHFNIYSVNEDEMLRSLTEDPEVLIAQFNHYVEDRNMPDDTLFPQQWNMLNIGQTGGTSGSDVRATSAWDLATGGVTASGDTIVIAIIDQGYDLTHPDLHYWKNYKEIPGDEIDNDNNGYTDDYDGWNAIDGTGNIPSDPHGTHVSGIAGARGNNLIGVTGVNWNVQIMPVKGNSGIESIVIEGYGYALEMRALFNSTNGSEGAFVVSANSSFGIDYGQPSAYPLWCAMYDSMGKYGILHATATANANSNIDVVGDMPTACPSDYMISVTNTTSADKKNTSAAYGANTIDLGAPGTGILSTFPVTQGSYGSLSGCSMSSPHVAGAVALLFSLPCIGLANDYKNDPAGTALRIKGFILDGVDTIPDLTGNTVSGGRLNVYNSMQLAAQYYNCIVGVEEANAADELIIAFPNPATDVLKVMINHFRHSNAILSVRNILGETLITKDISTSDHEFSLDISGLENGLYFLSVKNDSISNVVTWIKVDK